MDLRLELALELVLELALELALDLRLDLALELALDLRLDLALDLRLDLALEPALEPESACTCTSREAFHLKNRMHTIPASHGGERVKQGEKGCLTAGGAEVVIFGDIPGAIRDLGGEGCDLRGDIFAEPVGVEKEIFCHYGHGTELRRNRAREEIGVKMEF